MSKMEDFQNTVKKIAAVGAMAGFLASCTSLQTPACEAQEKGNKQLYKSAKTVEKNHKAWMRKQ